MDLPQVVIEQLRFSILPDIPSINTNCNIAVLPARAGGMLTVSDSVIIDSANNGIISCPSFCGIILSLAFNELHAENGHVLFEGRKECAHPLASSNSPLVRIQWHIVLDGTVINPNLWPPLPEQYLLPTTDLLEASITNGVVWVSTNLIMDTTFFPHISHCKNQLFGPLSGRMNTYFIRFHALFEITGEVIIVDGVSPSFRTDDVDGDSYLPYDSSRHTLTERRAECLMDLTLATQKLLIKTGQLGGTYGETFWLSREGWSYFFHRLSNADTSNSLVSSTTQKETQQRVTFSNLTLQSLKMPTTKIEVRAVDSVGYDAVRRCLSLGIGTGIRKRHPRLSTIGTPNNNLPVRIGDTVNLVDVDTTAYDDDQMESWQPDRTAAQRQPNFIKFVYNTRSREV